MLICPLHALPRLSHGTDGVWAVLTSLTANDDNAENNYSKLSMLEINNHHETPRCKQNE